AIDYKAERFEDLVSEVDLVFDLVAGDTQERSWAVLKDGGTIVSTLARPSERQAKQHHARATNYVAKPDGRELGEIAHLIDEKKGVREGEARLPVQGVGAANGKLEPEEPRGKIGAEGERG